MTEYSDQCEHCDVNERCAIVELINFAEEVIPELDSDIDKCPCNSCISLPTCRIQLDCEILDNFKNIFWDKWRNATDKFPHLEALEDEQTNIL